MTTTHIVRFTDEETKYFSGRKNAVKYLRDRGYTHESEEFNVLSPAGFLCTGTAWYSSKGECDGDLEGAYAPRLVQLLLK